MKVSAVFPQGGTSFSKTILKGDFPHLSTIRPDTGSVYRYLNTMQKAFEADVIYGAHDTMMFLCRS